jgi:hypothetical protein
MNVTAAESNVRTFSASKLGEEPENCEDVVRVRSGDDGTRIAVCDGASTASFSADWAARLADWYVGRSKHPDADALLRMAPVLGRAWRRSVGSRPLPWHAEEKMLEGSYAALLGLTVSGARWTAMAVGDTCLFHVRDGTICAAFPYTTAERFAERPLLVWTGPTTTSFAGAIQVAQGDLHTGDVLVVATDGFANWLLSNAERNRQPWDLFQDGAHAIQHVVDEERAARRMRNDDVACAWFTL